MNTKELQLHLANKLEEWATSPETKIGIGPRYWIRQLSAHVREMYDETAPTMDAVKLLGFDNVESDWKAIGHFGETQIVLFLDSGLALLSQGHPPDLFEMQVQTLGQLRRLLALLTPPSGEAAE